MFPTWSGVSMLTPWSPGRLKGHHGGHSGGEKTLLSTIRPCDMGISPSWALDMNGSPHQSLAIYSYMNVMELES